MMDISGFQISHQGDTVAVEPLEPVVTAPQMRDMVAEICPKIEDGRAVNVVFDMSHVEYLDSACLAKLFALLSPVQHASGHIALAQCQPNVEFLLRMTRLDLLFELTASVDEAMARLRQSA
ncbi:MAG: STAS domain-containing protein [Phycisphaeraceae bacterium]|nr:STAS domain-containing protein [Phycisphaeraceae bacterium]